jgi:hypothetical protein
MAVLGEKRSVPSRTIGDQPLELRHIPFRALPSAERPRPQIADLAR